MSDPLARALALRAGSAGTSGGAAPSTAASRAAMAALAPTTGAVCYLTEAGREGMFVFNAVNLSSQVTADTRQGIYIAPSSDTTGASGAWVRVYTDGVSVKWFGTVADGVTDDSAAFVGALALLKAIAVNADTALYKGSTRLLVPAGNYYLGTTALDIFHTLIIEGDGNGQAGGIPTRLIWAAGTDGFRIQRDNTSGVSTVDPYHFGGDATTIRNLFLKGGFTTFASEGDFHGIRMKARCRIENCAFSYWQGDGIHINAIAGGGVPNEGNANCFSIIDCFFQYCQNGISIAGSDANAGYTQGCSFSQNRQWGLIDSSFLGNTHIANHSENNGWADNGLSAPPYLPPTFVSYSGNRYYVIAGQEAGASTNAPSGTSADNIWWGYCEPGAALGNSIPTWASGTTYRIGGAYRTTNANAACAFINCYSEDGQAPPQFDAGQTFALGGVWGSNLGQSYGCRMEVSKLATTIGRQLVVNDNLTVYGTVNTIGPSSGAAHDISIDLNNTNNTSQINFNSWSSGVKSQDGYIYSTAGSAGGGLHINGISANFAITLMAAGLNVATVKSTAFDLATGKVLSVGGTQVVAARQTGWSAWTGTGSTATKAVSTATVADCAAAIKSVIDALMTHGLIGT